MRFAITLFFLCLVCLLPLQAQEAPQTQMPLVTKVTATWCSNCGSWGWDFMELALDAHEDEALFLGAHYSGDFENDLGDFIDQNFSAIGQPVFFLGNEDLVVTRNNVNARLQTLSDGINQQLAMSPVANTGIKVRLSGNQLQVNSKTRFFQSANGEYYLAMYVVENDILNRQASQSGDVEHPYVARAFMHDNPEGILISQGSVQAGTEFDESFSITSDSEWDMDNIHVYAILWEKQASRYIYLNGHGEVVGASTGTGEPGQEVFGVGLLPNLGDGKFEIKVNLPEAQDVQFRLVDQKGTAVLQTWTRNMSRGESLESLNIDNLVSGLYYLQVTAGNNRTVEKLIIGK